jgi:hypothetical protein
MIPTKDTVTVEKAGTLDDWGRPTGTTSTQFKGRVDYRSEVVKTSNGEDAVSKAIILIKGVALITVNDTIKWTDEFGNHEAKPISVTPLNDLSSKVLFTKVVI